MQRLNLLGALVIMLSARLQVQLPAIAADGHLHDLGGAFIDPGDANVAADLLHHVLVGVAVAAQRLNAGVGSGIAGFRRHVFRDRAFGVQAAFVGGIDALGRLFDEGAASFQMDNVRHDQLVGVALLLGERRSALNAL